MSGRTCPECGTSTEDKIERVVHCSISCASKARNRRIAEQFGSQRARARILSKLIEQPNGCLHWTGFIDPYGYGRLGYRGVTSVPLQRAVYQEFVGPIPAGMEVDHVCHSRDTSCAGGPTCLHRRCGNAAHLEVVTQLENGYRGRSFAANNRRKTHCPHGHEYTEANTYSSAGRRYCVACYTARHGHPPTRRRGDWPLVPFVPTPACESVDA